MHPAPRSAYEACHERSPEPDGFGHSAFVRRRELKMEGTTGLEPAMNSLKGCLLGRFAFIPYTKPRSHEQLVHAARFELSSACF